MVHYAENFSVFTSFSKLKDSFYSKYTQNILSVFVNIYSDYQRVASLCFKKVPNGTVPDSMRRNLFVT